MNNGMIKQIDQLKEYEHNELIRNITDDRFQQLCESLLKNGWIDPIVINQDNVVLGGNQRLRAANHLISQGYKDFSEVPVFQIQVDDPKVMAEIALQLNTHYGEHNWDGIAELLSEFDIDKMDLIEIGFNETDIEEIDIMNGEGNFAPTNEIVTFDDIAERQKNKKIKCPYCHQEFNPNE